jgi:hypothetical protein
MRNGELSGQERRKGKRERREPLMKEIKQHRGDGVIKKWYPMNLFGRQEVQ